MEAIVKENRENLILLDLARQITTNLQKLPGFSLHHGVIEYMERLYILKDSSVVQTILEACHNSIIGGDSRIKRMWKRISI